MALSTEESKELRETLRRLQHEDPKLLLDLCRFGEGDAIPWPSVADDIKDGTYDPYITGLIEAVKERSKSLGLSAEHVGDFRKPKGIMPGDVLVVRQKPHQKYHNTVVKVVRTNTKNYMTEVITPGPNVSKGTRKVEPGHRIRVHPTLLFEDVSGTAAAKRHMCPGLDSRVGCRYNAPMPTNEATTLCRHCQRDRQTEFDKQVSSAIAKHITEYESQRREEEQEEEFKREEARRKKQAPGSARKVKGRRKVMRRA